jgi:hypothetical protein
VAPSRTVIDTSLSAPGAKITSLPTTPVRMAVAVARASTMTCESSSSPRASTTPSMRQTSFGRKPTRISMA